MNENISFEEAMSQLESTVSGLESGNMSLDDSIIAFEEAVRLVRFCNTKLENAEKKVKLLIEKADGTVADAPFFEDEN